jgi:Iron-containing redox enzyme
MPPTKQATYGVVTDLTNHVAEELERSSFFSALRQNRLSLNHVRNVMSQYYLWRNAFHRWFGVCIAKSPPFGTEFDTPYVLAELAEHIEQEITGDHLGMCQKFLSAIGVRSDAAIEPIPPTLRYIDSYADRFLDRNSSFEEALAALAGRELVAVQRNKLIYRALSEHYHVAPEALEFFRLHEELEEEHFKGLWDAVVKTYRDDTAHLHASARSAISAHIDFWDEVAAAYA